jgi:outer membrane protein TolC
VADFGETQALAAFLPSLSASSSTSKNSPTRSNANTGQVQTFPNPYSNSFSLSANLNLFTGFQRGALRRQAEATSAQNDAALLQQQFATALATKQAFFQALASLELVGVQQAQLRRSDEQLKLTSERLRLGATTRSDSLRARVDYGNSQLALINAQNNLRTAEANLARAIQVDGLVMAVYDSSLEVRVAGLDTAALRREAMAAAPSVRQADAALSAARAGLRASRSSYLPTVSLGAGLGWAGSDNTPYAGTYRSTWNYRLSVSFPLFNNLSREAGVISADANVDNAQARLRDARLALDANLTQQLAALDAAAASIDVSTVSVAAAEEDLRMQRERYRIGVVTILEVLTSQASLEQAQVNLVQARYNYLVARAQIEALVGHSL